MDFRVGDRVALVHTHAVHGHPRPGTRGWVTNLVWQAGVLVKVGVDWDDTSALAVLLDEGDVIKKVEGEGQ